MADVRLGGNRRIAAAAAAAVLVLALGALIWPDARPADGEIPLLVFDPSGRLERAEKVYRPLAEVLAGAVGRPVSLRRFDRAGDLLAAARGPDAFVLAPDGLALALPRDAFAPVAVGRGEVPRNLRPRSVLLWRRSAGAQDAPWRSRPARTVLGDTLSLPGTGVFAFGGHGRRPAGLASGPDPYDHGAVLHAARLGAFDYAVVRQWDVDRFFACGLLERAAWEVRPLTAPVPDIVLLAARGIPAGQRLAAAEALGALGRRDNGSDAAAARLLAGLERLQLAGFNLLLEPDLDLVRGQLAGDWPRGGE